MNAMSPDIHLCFTLNRHCKPISTLEISPDGRALLSGDDDGLIILWNMDTGQQLQEIWSPTSGPIMAAGWIHSGQNGCKAFAFSCYDGSIHVYAQLTSESRYNLAAFKQAHAGPVEDLAIDHVHRRVASVGHGTLQVWQLEDDNSLTAMHDPPEKKPFTPRSVQFCDQGEVAIVFYMENHEVIAYEIQPFKLKWATKISTRIGYATLSTDQQSLLICNLVNGVDSYVLSADSSTLRHIQSYRQPIRCNVALQLASALQGTWVIVGSDDGSVRIFDQRSGELIKSLRHADDMETLIQTITVRCEGVKCVIVSGSTSPGPSSIKVWSYSAIASTEASAQRSIKISNYSRLNTWQVLLVVIITSVIVNTASMWLPKALSPLYTWLTKYGLSEPVANGTTGKV